MKAANKILVIIPAYNEQDSLGEVVARIKQAEIPAFIAPVLKGEADVVIGGKKMAVFDDVVRERKSLVHSER